MADKLDDALRNLPVALGIVLAQKYRLDHVLGVGGMAVVYGATHLQLDQAVAIKAFAASVPLQAAPASDGPVSASSRPVVRY